MKGNKELNRPMLERLVRIHEKIKANTYPNTTQLSKILEVGTATVSRDIEYLRDRFYAPIEYDYINKGYYYEKDFDLPLNALSENDMEALVSAKILLSRFKDTPLHEKLCSVIDFLAPNEFGKESMINRIATPPVPKVFYDKNLWITIYNAMKTNQVIEMTYNGLYRKDVTKRRVHPYQLVMDEGQVYLLGYCELRKAERIFSLTRIKEITVTEDTFELPDNYDFSDRCEGGKFGFFFSDNKTKFKIRFFGISKEVVKERLWADDQVITEGEKYVDLSFSSNQQLKILHWVLSLGYTVKPLEPEWFVNEWKNTIKKMAQMADLQP